MTAVENAWCLEYITEEDSKWKSIHEKGAAKRLPVSEEDYMSIIDDITACRAVLADVGADATKKRDAREILRLRKVERGNEIKTRRFHQIIQNILLELMAVNDTLVSMLQMHLPAIHGSMRDLLKKRRHNYKSFRGFARRRLLRCHLCFPSIVLKKSV